jgi:MFS family permease
LTIYLWGRVSDRLSNKAVLAIALPVFFFCMLGMVFSALPALHDWMVPALYAVHIIMGAACGGIGLATGNIGLKLAPQGQGTSYLAAISLVGAAVGGIAPVIGGALAAWFSAYNLSVVVRWMSPLHISEFMVLGFRHWEFLFAISAALGLYVLHALSRVTEGEEISERAVMQELGLEAVRAVNALSSIAGLLAIVSAFGRLLERRSRPR